MNTLFIYDNNGKIYFQQTGFTEEPVGLPYIIEKIPENAFPIKVNVEASPHFIEYGYHPKPKIDELEELIEEQNAALFEVAEMIINLQNGGKK